MRIECRAVGLDFLEVASQRFVNEVVLAAPPERVFELLADPEEWPRWFTDILHIEWLTSAPHGVGSRRRVALKTLLVEESFLAWEPGKRFAFRFDVIDRPLVRAAIEDYVLAPSGDGATRLTWTLAFEPSLPARLLLPIVRFVFGRMLRKAARSFERRVAELAIR